MAERRLRPGKLPPGVLKALVRSHGAADRRVLLGPRCGEDAAVVALGRHRLVLKSDPITFTAERIGWYAVHVNANDLAVTGARACWFQPTILLPAGSRAADALGIARDVHRTARALGIAVTGGHTEVTDAVTRPVVAGDMQGLLVVPQAVRSGGARPGERLLMTQAAGLEGTTILADLAGRRVPATVARAGRRLRTRPGISVVREALAAARAGVSAMHDPTEGGVRAAVHEMADAAGCGITLDLDRVPVLAVTRRLCRHFDVDPLALVASGTVLVAAPAAKVAGLLRRWARLGVPGTIIGEILREPGVRATRGGRRVAFPWVAEDAILGVLEA